MLPQKRTELVKLVSQYDVSFENIVDDKKSRQCFHEYLKSVNNEVLFTFMNELDHYVTLIGTKARYKAAKKIVDVYLSNNSPYPVSKTLRQDAYDVLSNSNESNCPKEMFDAIRLTIYTDMQKYLPEFLDSDVFRNHVMEEMKVNTTYMESVGTPKTDTDDCTTDDQPTSRTDTSSIHDNGKDISDIYDPKDIRISDDDFNRI